MDYKDDRKPGDPFCLDNCGVCRIPLAGGGCVISGGVPQCIKCWEKDNRMRDLRRAAGISGDVKVDVGAPLPVVFSAL